MNNLATRIYIVRHAENVSNVTNTFGGNHSLTKLGEEQAMQIAKKLPLNQIKIIYSSHLKRAIETAKIIKNQIDHEAELLIKENLRERHFGNLEGKEILQEHKDINNGALAKAHDLIWDVHLTDDDETFRESHNRYLKELKFVAAKHPGETILVVSHGSVMRSLLVSLGYSDFRKLRGGTLKNTGFILLDYSNGAFGLQEVVGVVPRK